MEAYILEWLNLILRWTHMIVGIAWIGSSFYFVWLDMNLNTPPRDPEDAERVSGDLWAVHGGGFYHAQKYKVAPKELPEPLHWFKWEAYTTWMTGFALFTVLYYANADVYLVDKSVADISAGMAVLISLGLLLLSWWVYHLLCNTKLSDKGIAAFGFLLLMIAIYGVAQIFGGRGAYMQIGVMLGTIMFANVLMVVIPGQKQLVKAKERGEEPDPIYAIRGKQRSVHNNYITLPVLFVMISNHYPMTYGHQYNWLLLIIIFIVGAMVRHFFNLSNQGKVVPALPVAAVIILFALAIFIAPKTVNDDNVSNVTYAQLQHVLKQRCTICHSANPNHPTAPVAPNGVMFDTPEQLGQWAARIHDRSVVTRTMPLANLTQMTDEERQVIDDWYKSGAKTKP